MIRKEQTITQEIHPVKKYCYPNCDRECISPEKCEDHVCFSCHKTISDCEWVVNWGSCNDCFDKHYEQNQGGIS